MELGTATMIRSGNPPEPQPRRLQSSTKYTGNEGCPCINSEEVLSKLTDRTCQTPNGEDGVQLSLLGSCVPLYYGSEECLPQDLLYDQEMCQANTSIPEYCSMPWCYVDLATCKSQSYEQVYQSIVFEGLGLYYSYSTCNGTSQEWMDYAAELRRKVGPLGGVDLTVVVPYYEKGMISKRGNDGKLLEVPGSEYYDDSIPYEGILVDYLNSLASISNGDIKNITFTHRSKSSSLLHASSYTAAVQDMEDGLAHMSLASFWITAERLKMTGFSLPFAYDRIFLVIKKPQTTASLGVQASKVLEPFTPGLWGLIVLSILFAAVLSVWFSERHHLVKRNSGLGKKVARRRISKSVYGRLFLDSFLEKGMFFFSAGVEQDKGASLPHKLLMFGFCFLVLVSVSAYVANLAAFLTRSQLPEYVGTMAEASAAGTRICSLPSIQTQLESEWPDATFVYSDANDEYVSLFELFDAGKCDAVVVGNWDTRADVLNRLCKRDLVFTDSLALETPLAFPVIKDLAPGISYWMLQAEELEGLKVENPMDSNAMCSPMLSAQSHETTLDDERLAPENMSFPFIVFLCCALLAIVLHLVDVRNRKKKNRFAGLGGRMTALSSYQMGSKSRFWRTDSAKSIIGAKSEDDTNLDDTLDTHRANEVLANGQNKSNRTVRFSLDDGSGENTAEDDFHDNTINAPIETARDLSASNNSELDVHERFAKLQNEFQRFQDLIFDEFEDIVSESKKGD